MNLLKYVKDLFSFLWNKPKTPDDKLIKRYDFLIFICATFLLIWGAYFFINMKQSVADATPTIVAVDLGEKELHPLLNNAPNTQPNMGYAVAVTPATLTLKTNEFYIGEIVGVKYFGIFGIVTEKILGTGGYTYEVRWRDTSHGLPRDVFRSWELYRPDRGSVPTSVLIP